MRPSGDLRRRIGVVFGSLTPPEAIAAGAARAEQLGFDELWFSEDCYFTGGFSGLTTLLDVTSRVPAGLGLVSVATRHPAVLAMELAGIARMHPGRARLAVGLGNVSWLRQMGVMPTRPLAALTTTFDVLRELGTGAEVDRRTSIHELHGVRLDHPPFVPPELWIGAVNDKALAAAGPRADGVLLSVLAGPRYTKAAVEAVAVGASAAGRDAPPVTAYALASVDDDPVVARGAVRDAVSFFLGAEAHTALVGNSDHGEEVRQRLATSPGAALAVDDAWIDEYAAAGDPATVAARLEALFDAGADAVALWVFPPDSLDAQLERVAFDVLPLLGRPAATT